MWDGCQGYLMVVMEDPFSLYTSGWKSKTLTTLNRYLTRGYFITHRKVVAGQCFHRCLSIHGEEVVGPYQHP